jgi:hypothetical protein
MDAEEEVLGGGKIRAMQNWAKKWAAGSNVIRMGLKKTGKMSTTHSFNFATADFVGFQRLKNQINVLALKITKKQYVTYNLHCA